MLLFVFLGSVLAAVFLLWAYVRVKSRPFIKYSELIPGPRCLPIVGNCMEFGFNANAFKEVDRLVNKYGKIYRLWLGPYLTVSISDADYIEVLLSSNTQITKSMMYSVIKPWLGEGLLTSTGEHWRSHRKLLTPAFHFKILEQFVEVFNRNGHVLLDKLQRHVGGPQFDVTLHMNLCALDNIAETAMGVVVDAQNGNHSDYVQAVHSMGKLTMERILRPWLFNDFIFGLTASGKTMRRNLSTLHSFTNAVIKRKKQNFIKDSKDTQVEDFGIKRRLALLDLMIEASDDGVRMSDEEIREEVDTFMFEGHDTTTSALCMTVWCLSRNQFAQDKAYAELRDMFGDSDRDASYSDLQNMRYLDMVVKETLRLYPSVPLYGRRTTEELKMGDYTIPAGCEVGVLPYKTHRRPEHFPDPDKFDPDRFLPENCAGRHPFAYVPFSAGPRNCIGQKFAMLEIKCTISKVLRKFKILPSDSAEEIVFVADFVIKPVAGVFVKLRPRTETL